MPKFCANLTMLYNEHPFLARFEAARKDGFAGVEYMFPCPYAKQLVAEALRRSGLAQVLHNLPAGNWEKGDRGIACQPGRVREFREGVDRSMEYATALGCSQLNCLIGIPEADADPARVHPTRHEPGSGEINYPYLFGVLDKSGYGGWVGCEYKPAAGTSAGLDWAAQYLNSNARSK